MVGTDVSSFWDILYKHHPEHDLNIEGDDLDDYPSVAREPPRCNRCYERGHWLRRDGRWVLYENGKPHVCKTSATGFEDEPIL